MFHCANTWRPRILAARRLCLLAVSLLAYWVLFDDYHDTQARSHNEFLNKSTAQQQTAAPQTADVVTLGLGKSVERELSGGQRQTYQLALDQGQYARVTIKQHGIDIVARLFAPTEHLIADFDSERSGSGSEAVELVARDTGNYKIEIAPSLPKARTGTYAIQLTDVHGATTDEKLLHEARAMHYESLRLNDAGKFDKAVELANRALEIRVKTLGPGHTNVAASLRLLGTVYLTKGDLTRAAEFLQRAEEVTTKASRVDTLDYADILHGLAGVAFSKGDHGQAEQLNLRALSIREKIATPESLPVVDSLFNLAMLYRVVNDLPKAEQFFLRAIAIREKLQGMDHADLGQVLNNLGLLYYGAGDYDSAEPIMQRALAIREGAFGPDHRLVGTVVNNLGLVEWKRRNYEKAEAYHRRSMAVFEKVNGPESYGVGSSLHNLGIIYKESGQNYPKAEEYYQRALAIWEKLFGDNSNTANALASLGLLYEAMGDFDRAEKFHLRAHAIYEKVLGPNNHYTTLSLRALADVYAVKGDIAQSMEYRRRLNAIEEKIIPLNLTIGSERQKIAYFTQLEKPDQAISFHARLAADNGPARDLAATKVLQRKGRILDALSENLLALRRRFNPEDRALLDKLADINSRLSRLVLGGPQITSPEEHQNQVKALEGEREKLEAEISRRSAGFYEVSRPVTLATVQAAIPTDAALIEFAAYRPVDLRAADDKKRYGEPHYVVYLIRRQGEVRWAELGPAKEIDARVDALRQALRDPERKDVRQLARAVEEKLMRPVRDLAGDAKHLLISPDGKLNLIPFEALVDEQGRYLVERYAFAYLTSGRDLLRLQTPRDSRSSPVVLADPAFGDPALIASSDASSNANAASRAQFNYSQAFFGPLPGIADEVRALKTLLPQATFLTRGRLPKQR